MKIKILVCLALVGAMAACAGKSGGDDGPADVDADDDGILDTDEGRESETDTDLDGTADYLDTDSDDDGIADAVEAGDALADTAPIDTDGDGTPDFRDLDSDQDCLADEVESRGTPPADTDGDGTADFLDRDSDGDWLRDGLEDASCDGIVDAGETDTTVADSDEDGATDLVETVMGTDASSPTDNPAANGDVVFVAPPSVAQAPAESVLAPSTRLRSVDLYVLLDRSGSMATEITAIRSNLATVVDQLTCPPNGTGSPGACVEDLWAGAGTIGYADTTADAFRNAVDVQPNPDFSGVPITEPSTAASTEEPLVFATWASLTGLGGGDYGMTGVPARATCAGSPADAAGHATFGYPCFREDALPVVLLATDEAPLSAGGDTFKDPSWSTVVAPVFQSRGARFIGIYGDGATAATQTDLRMMATATGSVDAMNGNAPLVFSGSGANAPAAIQSGVLTLVNGLTVSLDAGPADDGGDAVDAVAAFVERIETFEDQSASCTDGLTTEDSDADTFDDRFLGVLVGTPVCFEVVTKPNTTVPQTADPQSFRIEVRVLAEGAWNVDTHDVHFIVPPIP